MRLFALCLLAVAASLAPALAADKPEVQRVPGDGVLAWVEFPDLKAAIGHIEAASDRFTQALGADETVVAQALGRVMGEQELAALKPGAPVVLMVFAPAAGAQPDVAWYIPVKDAAALQQAATRWRQQSVVVDDVLVMSDNPARVDRAKAAIATYQALAAAPAKHDVRIHLSVARALAQWGPMAKMGIESAAGMAGMADPKNGAVTANVLKLELHGLLHLLSQVDDLQIDASTDAEALTLRYQLAAKAGTPLAQLLAATPTAPLVADKLLAPGENGGMAMTLRCDPKALSALLDDLIAHLAAEPATKPLVDEAFVAAVKPMFAAVAGEVATRVSFGEKGLRTESAARISDPAFVDALIKTFAAVFAEDGAFGRMYAAMGIRMQLQPAVRDHDGVPVNRLFADLDPAKVDAQQAAMMQAMLSDSDFAAVGGWCVAAGSPATVDAMIDRARAADAGRVPTDGGLKLKAEQVHGAGRALYVDYDVAGLFGAMFARMVPGAAAPKGEHEPVTVAAHWSEGVSRNDVRVPYESIIAIITTVSAHAAPAQGAPAGEAAPTF